MNRDQRAYDETKRKAIAKDSTAEFGYEPFDQQGGLGYDARKGPNRDCQECFGEGIGTAHFKDTRDLSPAARSLYAGVKQTKDGFQMLLIDKMAGLEKVFKHLGLYRVDNEQKADAFKEFIDAVQSKSGKLPVKGG